MNNDVNRYMGASQDQLDRAGLGSQGWNKHLSSYNQSAMLNAQIQADRQKSWNNPSAPPGGYYVGGDSGLIGELVRDLLKVAFFAALAIAILWGILRADFIWKPLPQLGQRIAGVNQWVLSDGIDNSIPRAIKKSAMDDRAVKAAMGLIEKNSDKTPGKDHIHAAHTGEIDQEDRSSVISAPAS